MEAVYAAAASVGVPAGSLPYMLCLFSTPALCAAHGRLRGTVLRHAASAALGVALCLSAFGVVGSACLVPPVLGSWALMAVTPRRCGALVFALAFGYLLWRCAERILKP